MTEIEENVQSAQDPAGTGLPDLLLVKWHIYRILARQPGTHPGELLEAIEDACGWKGRIVFRDALEWWREHEAWDSFSPPVNGYSKGFSGHSATSGNQLLYYLDFLMKAKVNEQQDLVAFFVLLDLCSLLEYVEAFWSGLRACNVGLARGGDWNETFSAFLREARAVSELVQVRFTDGLVDSLLAAPEEAVKKTVTSTFDDLMSKARAYRSSSQFREMIEFCARFRDYAPYNNMLVKVQNPSCCFFATTRDWRDRFGREVKEDARPMLILAPMHPVMLVYDLDQTEGPCLPEELVNFAKTSGNFRKEWLERLEKNLERDLIFVQRKPLSSTNAGFASQQTRQAGFKMRIAIHDQLDDAAAFSVLCHEAAHIYLGHLGGDVDGWWPAREGLNLQCVEIEAEAVAFIVASHLNLIPASESYLSGFIGSSGTIPPSVSVESIAKVSGKILERARVVLPPRKKKTPRA